MPSIGMRVGFKELLNLHVGRRHERLAHYLPLIS